MKEWIKKHLVLVISMAVAIVLLGLVGGRLYFVFRDYQKEKQQMEGLTARLDQLYQQELSPSQAPIVREQEFVADLTDEFNELNCWLSEGQVLPEKMEGADFIVLLQNTLRRIRDKFAGGRVAFPEKYTFGFEKYAGGQPPPPRAIPRLVQQLKITDIICQIIPDAAVNELRSFSRDEFEIAAGAEAEQGRAGRRSQPQAATAAAPGQTGKELFTAQHFKMAFRAREGSLLDLLNRLARLPMFAVVTWIEIINPRQEVSVVSLSGPAAPADDKAKTNVTNQIAEVSRDKRIVLGKEELDITVEFDVYNFGPFIDFREGTMRKKSVVSSQ